jgi:hypothetical protein
MTTTMKYFKRKYVGHPRYAQGWNDALAVYRARYQSIVKQLPETARSFEEHAKRQRLHDAAVESISRVDRGTIHVVLDDRRLEFYGVVECQYPEPLASGVVWMYDEMDLVNARSFELRVLFSEGDFRVVASGVRGFDKQLKRYVVPEQPAPPRSTLFLDRKHGRGQRKKE